MWMLTGYRTHGKVRGRSWFHPCLSKGFKMGSLGILCCVQQTGWPASFWGYFGLCHPLSSGELEYRNMLLLQLCLGSGDLTSGPHACMVALRISLPLFSSLLDQWTLCKCGNLKPWLLVNLTCVVIWMRLIPHRPRYLTSWSPVGGTFLGGLGVPGLLEVLEAGLAVYGLPPLHAHVLGFISYACIWRWELLPVTLLPMVASCPSVHQISSLLCKMLLPWSSITAAQK